jgi:hypothetical protein
MDWAMFPLNLDKEHPDPEGNTTQGCHMRW